MRTSVATASEPQPISNKATKPMNEGARAIVNLMIGLGIVLALSIAFGMSHGSARATSAASARAPAPLFDEVSNPYFLAPFGDARFVSG